MQNNRKRFLSILLALVMVFSLLPVNAFAEEDADPVQPEQFPEEVQNDEFIPLNLEEPVVENAEPAEITEQAAEEPAAEERGATPIEEATQEETLLREQPAQVMQEEPLLQNFEEPVPAAEVPVAQAVPTREYSFTEQPKAEPDENGMITVTWETDFTARRVWVYRCALTEEWPENPEPCVKLNYEEITSGSFDLQPDADHRYCLAVWYGEGDEDGILSEEFTLPAPAAKDEPVILKEAKDEPKAFNEDPISEQPLQNDAEAGVAQEAKSVPEEKGTRSGEAFTSPPETGDADPEAGYTVTWETNFTPTRVCIVKRKLSNNTYSEHAEVSGPYSTSMSYHFDYLEASSDYNYLVYAYTEIDCIMSTEFRVYNTSRAFIESPADSVLNPGYNLTLAWTTNFTPTRIQLRYWNRGESEINARTVVDKTTGMNKTMWLPVSYNNLASSPHWIVAAYYGDGEYDYVTSDEFRIILTGREFTSSPANCSVSPDSVVGVQWTTDFMPTKIQIGYTYSATDFFPKVTITSGLANSMGQYLDYNTVASGGSTWCIAAYYAEGKVEFSENFTINCVPRSFTQSPEGFELSPGESHLLSWKTNFMPTKIELCYYNIYNSSYSASVTLTEDLNTSMSYNLDYAQLPADLTSQKNWVIRAYHGGGGILPYITSQEFQIERVRPQVLEMPEEIRISREGNALFTWGTNFVPVKVEIRAKFWNSYQVVKTVTTGLGKRMTKSLSASELTYGGFGASSVLVYAYYNYSTPVTTSYETSVIWLDANKCGDNLTWELSEGGTLTISGTGPMWDFDQASKPWHSQRSIIQRVVINDGVTTIGENAFYFCDNITNVSLPASITEIGKQAFLLCMNLRSVYYDGFMIQAQQIVIKTGNSEFENASASYLYRSGELSSGVYWTVDGELDRLTISGSGGSGIHVTPPWQAWSEWITEIEIEEGIDTIWEDAFRDCSSVVVVGLPFSLQAVESGAFSACTGLSDVYYNGPLSDWTSLTYHIQAYNTPLTSAVIHTTERVGQLTDDLSWSVDDNGLLRIFVDPSLQGSGDETDIPNYTSATSTPWYGNYASDIVAVRMERGVTGIGNNAFRQLTHLSSVEIPYTVTYIGDYAFDSDSSLTSFIAPDGVTTIGTGAFRYCNGLEQIYLPESIMTLGTLAFGNCRGLKKVWLPGQIAAIPERCFENCSKLEMVNIPVTVNSIGNAAFNSCSALIAEGGEVYYGGTSAQFAVIGEIGNQYYLKNAWTVHFIPEEIAVNERNFPDAQFRAYVSENFDNDGSGWLTDAEITAVESFNDEDDNFTSLDGIEYFTELTHIYLVEAAPSLTSVDLSANTKLYSVDLSGNGNLAEINLEGLNELCYLDMSGNALTELHLTGLMDLENLSVSSNPITELDLSGLPLKELSCSNTSLTELDLSGKAELYRLNCYGSGISELDISECPILIDVFQNGTRTEKTDNGVPYVEYKKDTNHVLAVDEDCRIVTEDLNNTAIIRAASATFEGQFALNYYINLPENILADEEAYVLFTGGSRNEIFNVSDAVRRESDDTYRFSYKVVASEIRDNINVKLYDGENNQVTLQSPSGTDYTETGFNYSLYTYCNNRINNSTSESMRHLAYATIDYCTAAQIYFGYHADGLSVSSSVTAVQLSDLENFAPRTEGTLPEGITGRSISAVFESDNSLRLYFTFADGVDPYSYSYTLDGAPASLRVKGSGASVRYYLELSNVASGNLDDAHAFSVSKEDIVCTTICSVLSYARTSIQNGNEARQNLGKALYLYNMAANNYF